MTSASTNHHTISSINSSRLERLGKPSSMKSVSETSTIVEDCFDGKTFTVWANPEGSYSEIVSNLQTENWHAFQYTVLRCLLKNCV